MAAPGSALRRTVIASSSLLRTRIIPITRTHATDTIRGSRCPTRSSHFPTLHSVSQTRHSSYSAPSTGDNGKARKKVTIQTLRNLYKKGEPITMLTAHDFPSAHVADVSGMDMVLVGDSLGMVALGLENTTEVVMEEMILHCRSVARAAKAAFIIGDLPMGSYEVCAEQAIESSLRLVKEGRVHGVKIEGGQELAPTIKRITQAGVPVVGHVGLTPQRQNALGGFRVQGKTAVSAMKLLRDAVAMQEAGAFMLVLEAMPSEVASIITQKLQIPTIGIGAGNRCSGQVLVQVDMTGNFQPGRFVPKFVKQYADVWDEAARGISLYRDEVKSRAFPSEEYTYPIAKDELAGFQRTVDEVFQES
ncbi:3-methyl-2-oxobutanoate hydroxymethyltransferase PanB [Penicillium digitatum]|uniref:3-methyl-2-oxobutanoate hydroxymethyltransferase n=3 Tax=Penicillium digitatum TaxID=36651 RepID=K9FVG9_PEND2|nr:3-methyl-2-oxobutanoate hydroxymethyltransferase PanB [Penicillium digitatum Pd1]EKV12512.1 3-methyl-2-oxobutanoate hydroxymethyltransferase PanB [Penicillium digitatum PHI26]EKV16449.1 3-methyl-2-oxobutanoate hydroxymethyltransferase PanB [Penicillium digitatum Pd1]QQK42636.1 3-methyl-2-oxobutanoate hydroxymethyltransferase PanB [Penicillium digitatum]